MKESQAKVKKRSEERDDLETIKAAAWAVFQHNNGGGSNTNRHPGAMLVQQGPSRFKIEAQMKHELERRSLAKEALPSWDAGSTLFDKYELDSVFKHLDSAFQSADTQRKLSSEGSEPYDDAAAQPGHDRHSNARQMPRHSYAVSEQERSIQENWLDTVERSQRFRGCYLESVDETLPSSNRASDPWHGESLKPKLEFPDETFKDVQELVPLGKTTQFLHTPTRWNMLNGRRCSFDTSPDGVLKESKQSRKSKLLAIFKSKSGKDGTPPKPTRHARVVPDDVSQKKQSKGKTKHSPRLGVKHDAHDSDSSDGEANEYPSKGARMAPLSRAVRLSSDMSNPNTEQGLRDHLRHRDLTYGAPTARRRGSYSLNATSPVRTPRRSMLNGSRENQDDAQEFHHEHHHHYHHHHHHHIAHDDDDYELTVQDIVRRVPRKSFEEMAHRLPVDEGAGVKAPRNSLESPFFNASSPGSKLFL